MSSEGLIGIAVFVGALIFVVRLALRLPLPKRKALLGPDNYIVVDGSNVMYWGGEPSVMVLTRVLQAISDKGLTPIVYFDANVGYKLWDRYVNEHTIALRIGIEPRQVVIAPKGVTADELLLEAAVDNKLRVVTNDRFLDWREAFPKSGDKGFLVKGTWQQGTVMFRGF